MPTSSIGYWCSIAAHRYFARLQEKLEHLDITHWFFVLLTIEEGKGKLSQQELADQLDLDKVAMTRALDHLGQKGYVERCDLRLFRTWCESPLAVSLLHQGETNAVAGRQNHSIGGTESSICNNKTARDRYRTLLFVTRTINHLVTAILAAHVGS